MARRSHVPTLARASCAFLTLILMASVAMPARAQEPTESTPAPSGPDYGGARPGWYIALGATGTHLSLDAEAKQAFEDAGIGFEERGRGGELQIGYAFNPVFALELHMIGANHSATREDVEVTSGLVQLEAVTYLVTHGHVRPYLAGGIGGAAVEAGATRIDGGQVDAGGGLEVHVSRRFALSFNYRYSIQNYETATLELDETLREEIQLDASGESHVWSFRVAFSF